MRPFLSGPLKCPYQVRMRTAVRAHSEEVAPAADEWRELREGETVGGLLAILHHEARLPRKLLLASAVATSAREYTEPIRVLLDGDEVAILPPVSGGCL